MLWATGRYGTTRALITGIAGFVGKHLASFLAANTTAEIHGIARQCDLPNCSDVTLGLGLGSRLQVVVGDIMEVESVREIVARVKPDWIFHLAAQAFVPTAFADPNGTLVNNICGQVNLLEAVRAWGGTPITLIVCSNEEYGQVEPDEIPIKETAPFRPVNPYAVSKVAQDLLGYQYHAAYGMHIVRVRPFNHFGPGQSDRFVASSFARQIVEAELGIRPPVIEVGDLEAERDLTDVRDIVRGYYLAVLRGEPGDVYNLGSERAISMRRLLDILLAQSRIPLRVEQDPNRLRPADVPRIVADCGKFRALTGWRAEIPLERTVSDLLAYWRDRLSASAATQ